MMHKVWLLLLPGFVLLDIIRMLAVFKAANAALRRTRGRLTGYDVRLTSATGGRTLSSGGVALSTRAIPQRLVGRASTLFVSGDAAADKFGPEGLPYLREWLSANQRQLFRCAVLGSRALLPRAPDVHTVQRPRRGSPPTLRRRRLEDLPAACIKASSWRVIEPDQGEDLALSWIEADRGAAFADVVALRLAGSRGRRHDRRRRPRLPNERVANDARIVALHRWITEHLHEYLSVARLAQQVHMSTRSFARLYERATGIPPGRGLQQIRLDAARRMLETTPLPLKTIAARCGYGSQEVMRRAFVRDLQITPREYRRHHTTMKEAGAA